jgi:hypothetical protein
VARGKSRQISDICEVQVLFEQWRQTRQGKARIPDELWAAAVEVARRNGCNRTAATLHLDGGKLMKRMVAAGAINERPAPPAFMELVAPLVPSGSGRPEYTIELEGHNGTLRIHCKDVTTAELAALSRALWGEAS